MIEKQPVFLGLRLCEHDSNISLSIGSKVKHRKTERHLQIKHHGYQNLWEWIFVLKEWNIEPNDIDAIGIVVDDELYEDILYCDHSQPYELLKHKFDLFNQFKCPIYRIDHHYAHVKSCWTLGIDSTTDFVFDGFGDDKRSHSVFKSNKLVHYATLDQAESIGRLFGTIGDIVGMKGDTLDHAGKLMGLKSYGNFNLDFYRSICNFDVYDADKILNIDDWFKFKNSSNLQENKWIDWLNTTHTHLEKIFPNYFEKFCKQDEVITYSGGIAQNTVINSKIKKVIPNIHIPPHSPDDGLSLGCIEVLREIFQADKFSTANFPYWQDDEAPENIPSKKIIKETAESLANGKIVGWYQGNGEIGPRALGNRSVLMNPAIADGKNIINSKVKFREPYRPFGASILHEKTSEYFDWEHASPYMLFVQKIKNTTDFKPITHIDHTCRIQTVEDENPLYRELIEEFEKITGIPMVLNTSLNVGGKPIAGRIRDAWEIFYKTQIDKVVIGDNVLQK